MCRHTRWQTRIAHTGRLDLDHCSLGSDLHFFVHMKPSNRQLHVVRRLITAVGIHKNITLWSDQTYWVLTVQYTGVCSTGPGCDDDTGWCRSMATHGHRIAAGHSWQVNAESSWRLAAAPIPRMTQPGPGAETGWRLWLLRCRRRSAAVDGTARSVKLVSAIIFCYPDITGNWFVTCKVANYPLRTRASSAFVCSNVERSELWSIWSTSIWNMYLKYLASILFCILYFS